jgi:hypothetical protein
VGLDVGTLVGVGTAVGVAVDVLGSVGVGVAVRVKVKVAVAIRVGVRVEPGDAVTSAPDRGVGWKVKRQADTSTSTMTNTTPTKLHLPFCLLEGYGIHILYLPTGLGDDHGVMVEEDHGSL